MLTYGAFVGIGELFVNARAWITLTSPMKVVEKNAATVYFCKLLLIAT